MLSKLCSTTRRPLEMPINLSRIPPHGRFISRTHLSDALNILLDYSLFKPLLLVLKCILHLWMNKLFKLVFLLIRILLHLFILDEDLCRFIFFGCLLGARGNAAEFVVVLFSLGSLDVDCLEGSYGLGRDVLGGTTVV